MDTELRRQPQIVPTTRAVSSMRRRDGKGCYATPNRDAALAERKSHSAAPHRTGERGGADIVQGDRDGERDDEAYAIAFTCDSMKSISSSDRPYFA